MKIGILTQPLGANYGGILQAWALQTLLQEMGHTVEVLDRGFPPASLMRKLARTTYRSLLRLVGARSAPIFFEDYFPEIYKNNAMFIDEYINKTAAVNTDAELKDAYLKGGYDAIVVGSDQVWRPKYSPNIYNYFLDFVSVSDALMVAYAASFGTDKFEYSRIQSRKIRGLIKRFHAISVRERSGIDLCRNYFLSTAEHVLDPTLLLAPERYLTLIERYRGEVNHGGVFSYILDSTESKHKYVTDVARIVGRKIVKCQPDRGVGEHNGCIADFVMPSVLEWLANLYYSDYVVTDSYHGMVFSLLFKKKFLAIVNERRGAARMEDLAISAGAKSCLIYEHVLEAEQCVAFPDVSGIIDPDPSLTFLRKFF